MKKILILPFSLFLLNPLNAAFAVPVDISTVRNTVYLGESTDYSVITYETNASGGL